MRFASPTTRATACRVASSASTSSARILESRDIDGTSGQNLRVSLAFASQITAELELGNIMPVKRRRFEAYFTGGALVYDDLAAEKLVHYPDAFHTDEPLGKGRALTISSELPLTCEVLEFERRMRDRSVDCASLNLGVEVVSVLTECEHALGS